MKKKILITGAEGFIGKNLCAYFKTHKIAGDKPTVIPIGRETDIRDSIRLKKIFVRHRPDFVIHLAAKSTVEEGKENPKETFEINIGGTLNILEMTRLYKPEKTIIISTIHVYGNNPHAPMREDYFPQLSRPYETSKACADIIAQTYAESYNLPIEIPRFVNLYGPGDNNFSRVIPKIIRSILKDKSVHIWGGDITRDYLYIDDAISALVTLLQAKRSTLEKNRVINFGTEIPVSVKDIARKLIALSGKSVPLSITKTISRKGEISSLYASCAKAKRLLGWKPKVSLDEGLAITYAWYQEYFFHKKNDRIDKFT